MTQLSIFDYNWLQPISLFPLGGLSYMIITSNNA